MFTKRIIPCLDVNGGRVVKGVNFVDLKDAGDPVEIAKAYDKAGADELVFLDITASSDERKTVIDMVRKVAECVFIPFTVGGGIRTVDDFRAILREGADKISINSSAINTPELVSNAADKFGSQCVVVAIDAKKREDGSGWNTFLKVFDSNGLIYCVVYFLLIILFSYFYNTIQFNPVEISNNLKKNGGFVPGFRPGKPTADFLAKVINRLTMFGAIYLAIVALLPAITGNIMQAFGSTAGRGLAIGGTSIIIVVGVALETVKALEAQLMMRHYKGFLE